MAYQGWGILPGLWTQWFYTTSSIMDQTDGTGGLDCPPGDAIYIVMSMLLCNVNCAYYQLNTSNCWGTDEVKR